MMHQTYLFLNKTYKKYYNIHVTSPWQDVCCGIFKKKVQSMFIKQRLNLAQVCISNSLAVSPYNFMCLSSFLVSHFSFDMENSLEHPHFHKRPPVLSRHLRRLPLWLYFSICIRGRSTKDDGHARADSNCSSHFPPTGVKNYTFRLKNVSFETGICHDDIEALVTARQEIDDIFTFLIKIYLMYFPALLFLETDDYVVSHAAVFPLCNRMTLLSSSTVVLTVS